MIIIDGSQGEGGGQILRSSLSLSLVSGQPFRMENIRSGRGKPGLMRQHLTAVEAAAAVGRARVEGARIGSGRLLFEPRGIRAGEYRFSVGTAGSCTLVLQTVLPALLIAPAPSRLLLEGGTHNPNAPPFDFLAEAFLPLINRMGPTVTAELLCHGFYPAGGGMFRVTIEPVPRLKRLDLTRRGEVLRKSARAVVANLPEHIAERELRVARRVLELEEEDCRIEIVPSPGPGNILSIEIRSGQVAEVFTGFGERGVSAEKVAEDAAKKAREYLSADVPVGRYLADQLLLPMALAGGGIFRTLPPTRHMTTNAEVIRSFLPVRVTMSETEPGSWEVRVGPDDPGRGDQATG